jgi:hypothetical protein
MDKLKITFGIITTRSTCDNVQKIVDSIYNQNMSKESYEIIIIGECDVKENDNISIVPFNESQKSMWITKKKNIITELANNDIIVYMHDYLALSPDWYSEFIKFGIDWDICMNRIINRTGERILDWMGLPDDRTYGNVLLPYEYEGSSGMYIPGYYWIAKKHIMKEFPLNENFVWGEGEDIEWSKRVIGGFPPPWLKNNKEIMGGSIKVGKCKYSMNPASVIITLKHKEFHPNFSLPYDTHSGDESRPLDSTTENYKYLSYR